MAYLHLTPQVLFLTYFLDFSSKCLLNFLFTLAEVDQDGYVKSQIVIGTAGTVASWMRGMGTCRIDHHALQMFVLDEADIMMEESGFLHTSKRIVQ